MKLSPPPVRRDGWHMLVMCLVVMVLASPAGAGVISGPGLFLGVRAEEPSMASQAAALEARLAAGLAQQGFNLSAADVPLFETSDGLMGATAYIAACAPHEREMCEVVCGIRAEAAGVVGGVLREADSGAAVELTYTDVQFMDTLAVSFPFGSSRDDAAAILSGLVEAIRDPSSVAPVEEPDIQEEPGPRIAEPLDGSESQGVEADVRAMARQSQAEVPLEAMSSMELARECARHQMTPDQYRAWRHTGLDLRRFRRMTASRRGGVSVAFSVRTLQGVVAPSYSAESMVGTGDSRRLSVSWGLDGGAAQDVGLLVAYGLGETMGVEAEVGASWGASRAWYRAYPAEGTPAATWEREVDGMVRPHAAVGLRYGGRNRPGLRLTGSLGLQGLWLGPMPGPVESMPDSGVGIIPGARLRAGVAWESTAGLEVAPHLLVGAWAWSTANSYGYEQGPAGLRDGISSFFGLGTTVGSTWIRSQTPTTVAKVSMEDVE